MYLPASLSGQFDYHVKDSWFINSTLIVPLVYKSPMIERPVVFSVAPRFEAGLSNSTFLVVLYDFKYPTGRIIS